MQTFANPDELVKKIGEHLGYSDWHQIDQDRVNVFAEATEDRQWIHVDPVRAAQGPFGTTVAHGFLTLSLVPVLVSEIYKVDGVRMALNYGLDKVRFPSPLPTGSRVRGSVELLSAEPTTDGGIQVRARVTIERDGAEKPVCVAETVSRFYV
jgi:acyl dehydratase